MNEEPPPPPDLQYVLNTIPADQLKTIVQKLGLSKPANQAEAVVAAAQLPAKVVAPIYRSFLLAGSGVAVTWFRNVPQPSASKPTQLLQDVEALAPFEEGLRLVWNRQIDGHRAIRVAYHESEHLVRVGLKFQRLPQFGIATLIWRSIKNTEVLEVHSRSAKLPLILKFLHQAVTMPAKLEVMDVRPNTCCDKILKAVGGRYSDANFDIDDPGAVDAGGSFTARNDGDLADPKSEFARYANYPGRGRVIEFKDGTLKKRFKISQRDFSIVFSPADLSTTAKVFEEAMKSGTWSVYNS
ncbi:MAG: hypothetical protein AB7G38_14560 [Dehalococcoidia bacterium]